MQFSFTRLGRVTREKRHPWGWSGEERATSGHCRGRVTGCLLLRSYSQSAPKFTFDFHPSSGNLSSRNEETTRGSLGRLYWDKLEATVTFTTRVIG